MPVSLDPHRICFEGLHSLNLLNETVFTKFAVEVKKNPQLLGKQVSKNIVSVLPSHNYDV